MKKIILLLAFLLFFSAAFAFVGIEDFSLDKPLFYSGDLIIGDFLISECISRSLVIQIQEWDGRIVAGPEIIPIPSDSFSYTFSMGPIPEKGNYKIVARIVAGTLPAPDPCDSCIKQEYFPVAQNAQPAIPEINLLAVAAVSISVVLIISFSRKKN